MFEDYELDYETIQIYNISVTCMDPIHHFIITKNFSLHVNDLNEAPVELVLLPNTVREYFLHLISSSILILVTGKFSCWICSGSIV